MLLLINEILYLVCHIVLLRSCSGQAARPPLYWKYDISRTQCSSGDKQVHAFWRLEQRHSQVTSRNRWRGILLLQPVSL